MDDNYEFDLIGNDNRPFREYASAPDPTNTSPRNAVGGSQNVYKKISGNWANRFGLKRYDPADATLAGITSSFDWNTSLNTLNVIRTVEPTTLGNDGKVQVLSSITGTPEWYDLMTGLSYTRMVFDSVWDDTNKKDFLVFVMHDFNLYTWSGGITEILSGNALSITKSDNSTTFAQDGFAPTGIITVGGVPYTYTGGAGTDTLTGVTPDASPILAGSIGVATVETTSNKPEAGFYNDFIKTIGNRLHVGSYTSKEIWISANDDFTNYTVPTPRTPGSPELLTLDNTGKGISASKGNAVISAGTSDWYVISYQDITVGTTLTQTTSVDKKPTSYLGAALAHEFIDTVGDNIIYLAQDQQVRNFGSFRNLTAEKYPSLSQQVFTEFTNQDFTGGCLRCIGEYIRLTAPVNSTDYLYQTREKLDQAGNVVAERLWHSPHIRDISRFSVINGEIYGHSAANPQLYQLENTDQWEDDSPSGETLPYTSILFMSYRHIATKSGVRRQGMIRFDKVYYEGYLSDGTVLYGNVYFDYQGSTDLQTVNINTSAQPATFFSNSNPPSLGTTSLGDDPLGIGLITTLDDQALLPKFRAIRKVTQNNVFEYALSVYSIDIGARWEVTCLGANAQFQPGEQSGFLDSPVN